MSTEYQIHTVRSQMMGALQNSVVIHCLYMVIVKYAMYYGPIKTTQKYTAENDKNAQCVTY